MKKTDKPNRLLHESSPYLKQHAYNPVDWFPWGEEALNKSVKEKKPIFLSIGYSACHWCHVMEKESFEDLETAKLLNQFFVSIKVDREERPDLDHIYMSAVQMMTQHGGWPMSVFLTPEREPFYGGTYFPPEDRMGMPSFKKVLMSLAQAWQARPDEIRKSGAQMRDALQQLFNSPKKKAEGPLTSKMIAEATQKIGQNFDTQNGGFGGSPKFFHTTDLRLCLRDYALNQNKTSLAVCTLTLDKIQNGGIYDHLGGGFHRYSTDAIWLVPHFEKMLYDNALLSETFLEAFQATQNPRYALTAKETLNFVVRELTSPEGGFFSTLDADTEGVEGKFYVWTKDEIVELLGKEDAKTFCEAYHVSEHGNWEEKNILNCPQPLEDFVLDSLLTSRQKLLEARGQRSKPFRDEKILTAWNGLMIHSFALGYQVLEDAEYLSVAARAAKFIEKELWSVNEGLKHAYKDGNGRIPGFLEDYASLINGLVSLYECDFNEEWLWFAERLTKEMTARFWDPTAEVFYFTEKGKSDLIARPIETYDGALPSATAMAITGLTRFGKITGDTKILDLCEKALSRSQEQMNLIPSASGQLLIALQMQLESSAEWVLAKGSSDEDWESVLRQVRSHFLPGITIAKANAASKWETLKNRPAVKDELTFYLCKNRVCEAPLVGRELIESKISSEQSTKV